MRAVIVPSEINGELFRTLIPFGPFSAVIVIKNQKNKRFTCMNIRGLTPVPTTPDRPCLFRHDAPCIVAPSETSARGSALENTVARLQHECASCSQLTERLSPATSAVTGLAAQLTEITANVAPPETTLRMRMLEDILRTSPDLIIGADMKLGITIFNRGAEELTGYSEAEMLGKSADIVFNPDEIEEMMGMLMRNGAFVSHRTHMRTKAGDMVPVEMSASMIRSETGEPIYTVGISRDIRSRLRAQAQLEELAFADSLTGLCNRRHFDSAIAQQIELARTGPHPFCLALMDIDYFKTLNDRFGHAYGDSCLRQLARVLQGWTHGDDVVCRIGGEEFAIIAANTGIAGGARFAETLRAKVAELCPLTISVGVAMHDGKESSDELFARADACLYEAKRNGRNRVAVESQTRSSNEMSRRSDK
jgi:diguanylate cyclase (GGDEF)-like protein/PAS domain S-box-containing protein